MPSGGKCKEMTEQFSGSCRGEDSGSDSVNWGADLGSCLSPLRAACQPDSGKIREEGAVVFLS